VVSAARNRGRLAAAGVVLLAMFSCSYGDREDRKEDEKAKRTVVLVLPPPAWPGTGEAAPIG
jgi:hypothetical protein